MADAFTKWDLYVSPEGDDAWSGKLAEPKKDGTDGPFKTVERARDAIRFRKGQGRIKHEQPVAGGLSEPMTVWLRGGRYPLATPIVFGPEDSAPASYRAYPGEVPVLDGAVKLEGWKETEHAGQRAWIVDLPEVASGKWSFRSLYVDNQRRERVRLPKKGLYRIASAPDPGPRPGAGVGGPDRFVAAKGDICSWERLQEIEVVILHYWEEERAHIRSFDPKTREVVMDRFSRKDLLGAHAAAWAEYYVENVREALCEPGEWYLDHVSGRLTYLPLPGESLAEAEVYAPRCLQLLALVGEPDQGRYVEYLSFEGITFQHTDWRYPFHDGADFIEPSGDRSALLWRGYCRGHLASAGQGASDVPGIVFLEAARHCAFENCLIEAIGGYGIEIADASWGIRVVGNTMRNLGAGGVKINGADAQLPRHRRTGNHRITDNHIHMGGRVFYSATGVLLMHANRCQISHNHIHDFFYSGISSGWIWGYHESVTFDILIEKNHIHDLGQGLLSDMGGIYTLGVQPGTVIRGNLIHDVKRAYYGGWCIYPDEGSAHLLIEKNVCYGTDSTIFHQHYGRENVVRNNVFAFGDEALLAHSRIDAWHRGASFYRNILVTDGAPLFQGGYQCRLSDRNHLSDLNLFWDVSGELPETVAINRAGEESVGWQGWQALGHDLHSVVADPHWHDPRSGMFALDEDSPAWALGFEPIDLADVGVRPPKARD